MTGAIGTQPCVAATELYAESDEMVLLAPLPFRVVAAGRGGS